MASKKAQGHRDSRNLDKFEGTVCIHRSFATRGVHITATQVLSPRMVEDTISQEQNIQCSTQDLRSSLFLQVISMDKLEISRYDRAS